jgi:hypothetical protein
LPPESAADERGPVERTPATLVREAPLTSAGRLVSPDLRERRWPLDDVLVDEVEPDTDESAGSRHGALLLGIGALVLTVVLVMQVAHHFRQALARDALVGPVIRNAYQFLGRPLAAHWDLAAFELRQWGAPSPPAPDGRVTVRASLRNGAAFAQPMPWLRLELEDRFGGTVARRDFMPAEYLKEPAQAQRLLPPGSSTEAELDVVDASREAVGYRLDVCSHDSLGVVSCSQPAPQGAP